MQNNVYSFCIPKIDDRLDKISLEFFYEENDLERIKVYCEKDVVALIQVFLKMKGDALVHEDEVHYS